MTAETIARALGGRKVGQGWTARCPAHDDREPSLSIREADGKVLVRCHAGCDQHDVIAILKERGLWDTRQYSTVRKSHRSKMLLQHPDPHQAERSAYALSIWQSALPTEGMQSRLPARLPMHMSPRCHARTRAGTPCQSPAMANGRCRMHGGKAPGAARGNSNALKHGRYTADAIAERRELAALIQSMRGIIEEVDG